MDEPFSIKVVYKGQEYSFEAKLTTVGYTHKFYVLINGLEVIYEPDEERKYRAVVNGQDQRLVKDSDVGLIKAVGVEIELLN